MVPFQGVALPGIFTEARTMPSRRYWCRDWTLLPTLVLSAFVVIASRYCRNTVKDNLLIGFDVI
ncbi:MAG: hypothetical protein ACTSUE_27110 [Promethearchaeota archaeon]